jgi:WD40 repeat protein
VIIWDFNSGKLLKKYQGNNGGIWNVKISPDNSYVACGSWDNNQKAKGSSKNCLSILEQ